MFNYHQGWQQFKPELFMSKSDSKFHTISVNLIWRVRGGLVTKEEDALLKNFHDEHRIFQISEKLLDSYSTSSNLVRVLATKSIPDVISEYDTVDDISVEIVYVSECKDLTTGISLGTYGTKPILVDKPAKAIYQKFNRLRDNLYCH